MFSPEQYPAVDVAEDVDDDLQKGLGERAGRHALQAILVLRIDCAAQTFDVVTGWNLPVEPFNGAEKRWVSDVVTECFRLHPKPHVHAIGDYALAQVVRKFSHSDHGTNRVWFIPFTLENQQFIFLGFPKNESKAKTIPDDLPIEIARLLLSLSMLRSHREAQERLKVMELFVKEVGHDVASSVQATTATLRNISQGRIKGDAILRKAKQVEDEIMAAFRIADGLGIAVDRDYRIREPRDYDLIDVLNAAVEHHRSEAAERRNMIKLNLSKRSIPLYGDQKAIEIVIGHLLMNAIKYSNPDSYVSITAQQEKNKISLTIKNKGLPLPDGEERSRIWEFGVRGRGAKEQHVNGSGIGLFTVRKILYAHGGQAVASSDPEDPTVSRFTMTLPTDTFAAKLTL